MFGSDNYTMKAVLALTDTLKEVVNNFSSRFVKLENENASLAQRIAELEKQLNLLKKQ